MAKKKTKKQKKTVDEKIGEALSITPDTKAVTPDVVTSEIIPVEGEVIDADIVVAEKQELVLGYPIEGENPDINKDYEQIRKQLASVASTTSDALDKIKEVADQSEAPRAYEVVGQLAKVSLEAAEASIKLHRDMKALRNLDSKNNQRAAHIGDVNNALFVGTTDELLKLKKAGKLPYTGEDQ